MSEPVDSDIISMLERRLAREKKAREEAESLLIAKSREIYQANQELQEALAQSEQKRQELAFLARSTGALTLSENNESLLGNVCQLTSEFLHADYGIAAVQIKSCHAFDIHTPVFGAKKKWHDNPQLLTSINQFVEKIPQNNDWQDFPFSYQEQLYRLILRHKPLDSGSYILVCFLLKKSPASSEIYSILTIMFRQLKNLLLARKFGVSSNSQTFDYGKLQAQLKRARVQLEQSEKMASLGQLAAGVAHEINNPVGFVRSNMESLNHYLKDLTAFAKALGAFENVQIQSLFAQYDVEYLLEDTADIVTSNLGGLDRISEIVQGLKSFSHQGEAQNLPFDLNKIIQSALSVANNELKYKHNVITQLSEQPANLFGKAGQLQQVFINMFVNAAQAMPNGGDLEINSRILKDSVVVTIRDTGCGMDKVTQDKLFNPFFTTKPVGEGTGLGMSISYSIIEGHQGHVEIDSEVGIGTTFTLTFPLHHPN